jgi:hypothetical protein
MTKAGKPMSDSISGSGGVHDRCDPCIGFVFQESMIKRNDPVSIIKYDP